MKVTIRNTDNGTVLKVMPNWPGDALPRPGDKLRVHGKNFVVETAPYVFDLSGRDDALELCVTLFARAWGQSQDAE